MSISRISTWEREAEGAAIEGQDYRMSNIVYPVLGIFDWLPPIVE